MDARFDIGHRRQGWSELELKGNAPAGENRGVKGGKGTSGLGVTRRMGPLFTYYNVAGGKNVTCGSDQFSARSIWQ